MAAVTIPIPDERIIQYLEEHHALVRGHALRDPKVELTMEPPVANSTVSHYASVTLRFPLELGEVDSLIRP